MDYEAIRQIYRPEKIKLLFIAESPPPADASKPTTRGFYRLESAGDGDRLFNNMMQVLYPESAAVNLENLANEKDKWLRRFQADGYYLVEALTTSMPHEAKTSERVKLLKNQLPELISRVGKLIKPGTPIVLIKSNPYKVCAEPLRDAGYRVLNTETLNYPGYWQEQAFRTKLIHLINTKRAENK